MDGLVAQVRQLFGTDDDRVVEVAGFRYDPGELTSRADVTDVLGLTEREFVEAILVANGGCTWPHTFTDVTDWSASQVRTLLDDLEEEGAVVRLSAGRDTIVCLPGSDDVVRKPTPG